MASVPLGFLEEAAPPSRVISKPTWLSYAGVLVVAIAAVKLHRYWQDRFEFDDAYMYSRYAYNFRHGWGMSWNPGGPHTFGITSLPWFFIILAGSLFVHDDATLLTAASCITGILAIAALSWLVSASARSRQMRRPLLVFSAIAISLLFNWRFAQNWSNGMETMLGMLSVVLFLGAHQRYTKQRSFASISLLCLAAIFCVLVRPELLLVVLTLPTVATLLAGGRAWYRELLCYFGVVGSLLLAALLWNKSYFGTPVPLAFYLKAMHGYAGYRLLINPWALMAIFVSILLPFVLIFATLATRRHTHLLTPYLLSLLVAVLYLATVTQIMGGQARYYLPLLPMAIFPAMMLLDEALLTTRVPSLTQARILALAGLVLLSRDYTQQLTWYLGKAMVKHREYYAKPVFLPVRTPELPPGAYWKKAADFASQLPAGSTMAASEVGIVGASAPQVNLLDLAGLNNAHLALHPGDVAYIFAQKPDVIWMPHTDYTKLYGSLAAAPQLLAEYDLYAGALDFGLAIRRTSRSQLAFEQAVEQGWQRLYPGYPMRDYKVQQVRWDPQLVLHGTQADVLE